MNGRYEAPVETITRQGELTGAFVTSIEAVVPTFASPPRSRDIVCAVESSAEKVRVPPSPV